MTSKPTTTKTKSVLLHLPAGSHKQLAGTLAYAKSRHWRITLVEGEPPAWWRGDGAIVTLRTANARLIAFIKRLAACGIPVVDGGMQHSEISVPRVVGDWRGIGHLAAEHFAERHFRNVAWYSRDWSHVHALRYGAFVRSWRGDNPPTSFVWARVAPPSQRYNAAAFAAWLGKALLRAPRPIGVLSWNDHDAAELLGVCLDAGISVPEEVAILGVDNNEVVCENQDVPISSVAHDLEQISHERAALLDRLMDGAAPPCKPILIPPKGIVTRRSTDTFATENPTALAALAYIRDNLSRSFGVNQVAEAIGVSRPTLDRIFAAELGTSIAQETLRQRIAHAKIMLRETSSTISEIASSLGFCHGPHLSNAFRRLVGVSPGAFRRLLQSDASNEHVVQAKALFILLLVFLECQACHATWMPSMRVPLAPCNRLRNIQAVVQDCQG